MKRIITSPWAFTASIFILGLLSLIGSVFTFHTQFAGAIGGILRSGQDLATMRSAIATTSSTLMYDGIGTTTLTFPTDSINNLAIYLQANATSSATLPVDNPITIRIQGSDDGIDFFDEDLTSRVATSYSPGTTSIQLASSTQPFTWVPSVRGATSSKLFNAAILPSRFTRVTIFVQSSTTPGITRVGAFVWTNIVGQSLSTTR